LPTPDGQAGQASRRSRSEEPIVTAAEHDRVCLVSMAEEVEAIPSLSVALVSHDGAQPPSLSPLHPRVTGNLTSVRTTDDVVVCYTPTPADDVMRLQQTMGRDMPAVLVAARGFDPRDVVAAFDHGATSYLVLTQTPEVCIVGAAITTARGGSCLSPAAATTLLQHMHRPALPTPTEPVLAGGLTPRERQIMELLVTGHTIAEIAEHLTLTSKTVRNRLSSIYAKLQVRRQSEAILLWLGLHSQEPVGAHSR
jgi:DNA-binding NarL/FixJ family response regulator